MRSNVKNSGIKTTQDFFILRIGPELHTYAADRIFCKLIKAFRANRIFLLDFCRTQIIGELGAGVLASRLRQNRQLLDNIRFLNLSMKGIRLFQLFGIYSTGSG